MTTVYFVRHVEPSYDNHDDTRELSPKGLQDRKLVAAFLNDKQIDRVFSSPYRIFCCFCNRMSHPSVLFPLPPYIKNDTTLYHFQISQMRKLLLKS